MGDWTMMRWDDGWDAEPRRASKPYGKPWKLVLAPVNHSRTPWKLVALPVKHLERKSIWSTTVLLKPGCKRAAQRAPPLHPLTRSPTNNRPAVQQVAQPPTQPSNRSPNRPTARLAEMLVHNGLHSVLRPGGAEPAGLERPAGPAPPPLLVLPHSDLGAGLYDSAGSPLAGGTTEGPPGSPRFSERGSRGGSMGGTPRHSLQLHQGRVGVDGAPPGGLSPSASGRLLVVGFAPQSPTIHTMAELLAGQASRLSPGSPGAFGAGWGQRQSSASQLPRGSPGAGGAGWGQRRSSASQLPRGSPGGGGSGWGQGPESPSQPGSPAGGGSGWGQRPASPSQPGSPAGGAGPSSGPAGWAGGWGGGARWPASSTPSAPLPLLHLTPPNTDSRDHSPSSAQRGAAAAWAAGGGGSPQPSPRGSPAPAFQPSGRWSPTLGDGWGGGGGPHLRPLVVSRFEAPGSPVLFSAAAGGAGAGAHHRPPHHQHQQQHPRTGTPGRASLDAGGWGAVEVRPGTPARGGGGPGLRPGTPTRVSLDAAGGWGTPTAAVRTGTPTRMSLDAVGGRGPGSPTRVSLDVGGLSAANVQPGTSRGGGGGGGGGRGVSSGGGPGGVGGGSPARPFSFAPPDGAPVAPLAGDRPPG
jgi:hypothetical protein